MIGIQCETASKLESVGSLRCLSWSSFGPSMLVQIWTLWSSRKESFSSSISARLLTSVNSRVLPTSSFFSLA